jgi:hypothetical protein
VSEDPTRDHSVDGDHTFDELARDLANGSISRRRALKLFVGVAIAAVIPSRAVAQQQKVTICHKPGTPAEKTKEVPQSAVDGHLGHGDHLGPCETTATTAAPTTTTTTAAPTTTTTTAAPTTTTTTAAPTTTTTTAAPTTTTTTAAPTTTTTTTRPPGTCSQGTPPGTPCGPANQGRCFPNASGGGSTCVCSAPVPALFGICGLCPPGTQACVTVAPGAPPACVAVVCPQ